LVLIGNQDAKGKDGLENSVTCNLGNHNH